MNPYTGSKTLMSRQTLPRSYVNVQTNYPELVGALEALGKAAKQAGPLDEKSAQLIQLAAAASIKSEGAVHSHTRHAGGFCYIFYGDWFAH